MAILFIFIASMLIPNIIFVAIVLMMRRKRSNSIN